MIDIVKKEGEYKCMYYKGHNGSGLEELLPHAIAAYKEMIEKYGVNNVEFAFIPARDSDDDPLGRLGCIGFRAMK